MSDDRAIDALIPHHVTVPTNLLGVLVDLAELTEDRDAEEEAAVTIARNLLAAADYWFGGMRLPRRQGVTT
jgi:hypothetical protein